MELTCTDSPDITLIGWQNNILYIGYKSGRIYSYHGVKQEVFEELKSTSSKSQYMNSYIKSKYPYRCEVDDDI